MGSDYLPLPSHRGGIRVSMPQSAQHGFRLRTLFVLPPPSPQFQCLNRHSMGSDAMYQDSLYFPLVVSMPQSAQHGFRLTPEPVLHHPLNVSMPQSAQHGFRLEQPEGSGTDIPEEFQCLNRHSMGSDPAIPQAPTPLLIGVSMPQSAQHGFRPGGCGDAGTDFVPVSMPQSAQHGFRLVEAGEIEIIERKFQCLNRHSMGSDRAGRYISRSARISFNASIGTAWVQTNEIEDQT